MIFGKHLQVICFLQNFRLRDAVKKLPYTRMRARPHFFPRTTGNNISFFNQHHTVGDQEGARQLVGHHDDGHVEGFLQIKDQFIDASGEGSVASPAIFCGLLA